MITSLRTGIMLPGTCPSVAFVGAGDGPAIHSEHCDFNEALIAPVALAFDHVRRGLVGPG